jgi:hypothetical protein
MINLTNFAESHGFDLFATRVMAAIGDASRDIGSIYDLMDDNVRLISVGPSQGQDEQRGAYDWWPLYIDGNTVGELRQDACGMTIHTVAEILDEV